MTVPELEPLLPAVIVSQLSLLVAVHKQPAPAVTPTLLLLAMEATDALEAEIENVQGAAAWLTVNVWPATVKVPVRDVVLVLAATEKLTVPFPALLLPPVMVIQAVLLVAVQLQPIPAVTLTLPLLALDATDALEEEME